MRFHDYLAVHAAATSNARIWLSIAWVAGLGWVFFAIGPGLLFGTDLFGAPNAGPGAWLFGIPSIWAWQIMAWALGVLLIWLVAYRLGVSRPPQRSIEVEVDAIPRSL